jgi:branched-chain amino acid transport system substrate-binding protein
VGGLGGPDHHRRSRLASARAAALAVIAVLAGGAVVAGCGSSDDGNDADLTVYSAFPRSGTDRRDAISIERGVQMALADHDDQAGKYRLRLETLDTATNPAEPYDPEAVVAAARRAADDTRAIGFIGELNSGATALALPILSQAGVPVISPSSTASGLTTSEPGAAPGEPERYYPSGSRNFVRIVPRDSRQSDAIATLMRENDCRTVFIVHESEVYGSGLARNVTADARRAGMRIVGDVASDGPDGTIDEVAAKAQQADPDCVVYAGGGDAQVAALLTEIEERLPKVQIFSGDGLADADFLDASKGGLPKEVSDNLWVTLPALPVEQLPPSGQRFHRDYRKRYGQEPTPYAVYGYEAMQLLIAAIEAAKDRGDDREAVLDQLFLAERRGSPIGTYSIDANGDTTLGDYGVYGVENGRLVFDRVLLAPQR